MEKKPTNILGASLLKLPTFKKSPPSIAIEINPINASRGSATTTITKKRRGIIIRSSSELEQINQLLSNPKLVELAKKTEAINPKTKEDSSTWRSSGSNTDIFEI